MTQEFIQRSVIKRDYSKEKGLGLLQALLLCFELTGLPDSALSRSKRRRRVETSPPASWQRIARSELMSIGVSPGLSKASWR